ncbi:MAG: NUDIX hydrolase [Bacteroidetes bacterium]|nr:NUDIX hydrolase [Bacteroidota bacterium]
MSKVLPKQLSIKEFYEKGDLFFVPHISIDCVIFGFHTGQLKVLLLKLKDMKEWGLAGGFVFYDEPIEAAAKRIVFERTGLTDIYLTQFYTFGDPSRQRGKGKLKIPQGTKRDSWINQRFITIGHWALVEYSKVVPIPDQFSSACEWVDVRKVPLLMLDHNTILEKALQSLRISLNDYPIGKDLLPAKFTMPELQRLYETVLDKKLDRRNFHKRMLSLGILKKLKEKKKGGAHKAPHLYSFERRAYQKALNHGLKLGTS